MSPMPSTATTMKDTMKAARYGIQSQLRRGVDQTLHAWQRCRPRNKEFASRQACARLVQAMLSVF